MSCRKKRICLHVVSLRSDSSGSSQAPPPHLPASSSSRRCRSRASKARCLLGRRRRAGLLSSRPPLPSLWPMMRQRRSQRRRRPSYCFVALPDLDPVGVDLRCDSCDVTYIDTMRGNPMEGMGGDGHAGVVPATVASCGGSHALAAAHGTKGPSSP